MTKKNVLIVTHPLGKNVGGILQALALQKFIESLGVSVVTADFRPSALRGLGLLKYYVAGFFKKPSIRLLFQSKFRAFGLNQQFLATYIRTTRCIKDRNDLAKFVSENAFDSLVVGSDQIWRPKYVPDLRVYFLDFDNCKTKKISYAASFGVSDLEYGKDELVMASKALSDFSVVTVRESHAVDLCKKYLNVEATWVCDPTLLHDSSFYTGYESKAVITKSKFIFSYILDLDEHKRRIINDVCEKYGFSACCINSTSYGLVDQDGSLYSPGEWLSLIRDAEFVLTDSYHGMLFSIIYRKPFYVFVNEGRGASRFTSVLDELGLQNRLLSNEFLCCLEPIEYDDAFEANLARFIGQSRELLVREL